MKRRSAFTPVFLVAMSIVGWQPTRLKGTEINLSDSEAVAPVVATLSDTTDTTISDTTISDTTLSISETAQPETAQPDTRPPAGWSSRWQQSASGLRVFLSDDASWNASPVTGATSLISLMQEPLEPDQLLIPVEQAQYATITSQLGSTIDLSLLAAPRLQLAVAAGGAPNVILGAESAILNTSDVNDLIANSDQSTDIVVHARSQISNDPHIRGYRQSQIRSFADGAFWYPIRPDFDTPLSRIDSSIISDAVVLKGPYSVRYGSGFSVIDVALNPTPRYESGREWGGRTALTYETNGAQTIGRQSIWGGDADHGYRFSYGHRTGADYQTGDGIDMAGSYNSRDIDLALGYDLGEGHSLDFGFQRLDQTDVELPGQYFDIDFLVSNSFTLRYAHEESCWYDRLTIDSWWNRSRFNGNADNNTKPGVVANFGPNSFLADNGNIGEVRSTGARTAVTWGEAESGQFSVGGDFTFVDQEFFETADGTGPSGNDYLGEFGLPRSQISTPGIFADFSRPVNEYLTLNGGGRIDWTNINAINSQVFDVATYFAGRDPEKTYTLLSGYLNGQVDLTDALTFSAGFGYGERPPTPTDLYIKTFLEVLQPGAIGDFRGSLVGTTPDFLDKEQAKQFDLGLNYENDWFRGGIHGFYSWINDYVTYRGSFLQFDTANTNATLAGGELTGEIDLTCRLSAFGKLGYVEGRDLILDEPLWGIPPLDSRVGIRFVSDADSDTDWGFEVSARIVDNQDRVARSMFGTSPFTELATPGFTTFDARGYVKLTSTTQLLAGVENFGDKNYQEHLDVRSDLSKGTTNGVFRPGYSIYVGLESTY